MELVKPIINDQPNNTKEDWESGPIVAIIDTGVDSTHPTIRNVTGGIRITVDESGQKNFYDDYSDELGHGTAIADIICRNAPLQMQILSIKALETNEGSDIRSLIAGIRWAISNNAGLINISAGAKVWCQADYEEMQAVCREGAQKGCYVIAAVEKSGAPSIPASLDQVITVGSTSCSEETLYYMENDVMDFLAKGDVQRVASTGGRKVMIEGSSLATAHVTRMACHLIAKFPCKNLDELKNLLRNKAIRFASQARADWEEEVGRFFKCRTSDVNWIRRAIIYPYNKEMHALIRFRHLLPFEIVAVVDPPGKRLIGMDAGVTIGADFAGLSIGANLEQALQLGDTLIIGHTEELRYGESKNHLFTLINEAVNAGKNVFSLSMFENLYNNDPFKKTSANKITIRDPMVRGEDVERLFKAVPEESTNNRIYGVSSKGGELQGIKKVMLPGSGAMFRTLYDCPVLGIFGTSRSQGKFTLQIALREQLSRLGYNVAHLATEPTGMLLGATVTLPIGYATPINFAAEMWSMITRILISEIKNRCKPDIILVGGQSGIAAASSFFIENYQGTLLSMGFGIATQPDAVVLVCNIFDDFALIRRCINVIESVLFSRVVALAVNNASWEYYEWKGIRRRRVVRLENSRMEEEIEKREREFGLPCCGVLTAGGGTKRLAGLVVDFFSSFGPQTRVAQ